MSEDRVRPLPGVAQAEVAPRPRVPFCECGCDDAASKAREVWDDKKEQLQLIYDYAKFHIGLYATVSTGLIAILSFGSGDIRDQFKPWMVGTLVCFLVAGISGAYVASSLVYSSWDPWFWTVVLDEYSKPGWKFWRWNPRKWVVKAEHWFFWMGVAVSAAGLVFVMYLGVPPSEEMKRLVSGYTSQLNADAQGPPWKKLSAEGAEVGKLSGIIQQYKSAKYVGDDAALVEGECIATEKQKPDAPARLLKGRFAGLLRLDGGLWQVQNWSLDFRPAEAAQKGSGQDGIGD